MMQMKQKSALIFLTVALALLIPALLRIAAPFLTPFIIAALLAVMTDPLRKWFRMHTRRPALAAALATLTTVVAMGALLTVAAITLTSELTDAYNALNEQSMEEGGWPALATHTTERIADAVAKRVAIDKEAIRTELINRMKWASGYVLSNVGVALSEATNVIINGLLVTIFLYFLLRHGGDWITRLAGLAPIDGRTSASLIKAVRDSVMANMSGMFAVAAGQAVLLSIGFWIAGMHSPVLWGVLGGAASIVPIVGALLVWAPVAISYLLTGVYWKAIFLAVWGAIIVGSADNVLRAWVVGVRDKQHPMIIALAAIGGAYAFGALGIILGPLVVSLAAALIKEISLLAPRRKPIPQEKTAEEAAG